MFPRCACVKQESLLKKRFVAGVSYDFAELIHFVRAICNIFKTMHRSFIITEDSKTINLTKELLVKLL